MKKPKVIWSCLGAVLALLLAVVPAMAVSFEFNLLPGGDFGAAGNKGLSISAVNNGVTLTLSALTMVPDGKNEIYPITAQTAVAGGPTSSATGFFGTVYIGDSAKNPYGAGVQGWKWDKNNVSPDGSTGISGSGTHEDEALVLTFSGPVSLAGAKIYFNGYDISGKDDDSALIYIGSGVADGATPSLFTATIEANLVNVSGSLYYLALDDPDLAWVGAKPTSFTQIIVRNDGGTGDDGKEFYVAKFSGETPGVPEPMTLLLIGMGLVGLAGIGRKMRF
jgi:hypothetical protein